MPKRPPRMCAKQWCNKHAEQGYYCLDHQPVRTDERLPAHKRGYDSHWNSFRAVYLRQHPVCTRCGRAANVVHHIVPLEDGGDKFDDGNLEALCRSCHEIHHGRKIVETIVFLFMFLIPVVYFFMGYGGWK